MNYTYHIAAAFILICCTGLQAQTSSQRDTATYYLSPVIINPTQAKERETPVTFTNMNKQQIEERYTVQDIPVLLSELPSVTTYSENGNGIGYNYINLRGFDQRRLSIMVNGVPQNDPEDHNVYWIDFPDLLASTSDIQVQRGAGSSFYGPPAIGGSINLVTTPFSMKRGITMSSLFGFQEYGNNETILNTRKFETSVNSGLIENKYLLYGKLSKITSDGYRENSWVDLSSYYLGAVRLDENVTTRVHFFGGPLTDGLAYVGIPKFYNDDPELRRANYSYWEADQAAKTVTYAVNQKPQSIEKFSQPHYEVINEWRIDSASSLVNTLFYYNGEGYFDYDGDWIWYDGSATRWFQDNVGYDSTFGVSNYPSMVLRGFVENKHWGWLPRIEYNYGAGKLIAGAEMRFHRSTHWGKIPFASQYPFSAFDPDFHFYEYNGVRDILSAYVHTIVNPGDQISYMADIQLVHNRYGIQNEKFLGTSFDKNYLFLNPKIGVNYNIDTSWNSYLSFAYTSREPRLKNLYAAEEAWYGAMPQFEQANGMYNYSDPLVKPEHLFDAEIGVGYRTDEISFSANLFWMEFTDELVKSGRLDIFGQPVTGNAKRSRHVGIELACEGAFDEEVSFSTNMTVSRNRLVNHTVFIEAEDTSGNSIIIPVSLNGNSIAGFPDFLWNGRLTYKTNRVSSSLIAKYVGSLYTDNFEIEAHLNDEYFVMNFELQYRMPQLFGSEFLFQAEVRNLMNKLYMMNGEADQFFPAAERNYIIGLKASF